MYKSNPGPSKRYVRGQFPPDSMKPVEYRLAVRTAPPNENGCELWLGHLEANGYPKLGKKWAHRLVYEVGKGPIPPRYTIDHTCFVTACVALAHLEAVTQRENNLRGNSPNWVAHRAGTCIRGHPLAMSPTTGKKVCCPACQRLRYWGLI